MPLSSSRKASGFGFELLALKLLSYVLMRASTSKVLLLSLLMPIIGFSSEPSDPSVDRSDVLGLISNLEDSFKAMKGIGYRCETAVSTEIPRSELIAPRFTPERASSISVVDLSQRFSYSLKIIWWNHKQPQEETYSFDGTQSQVFSKSDNLLRISKLIRYESNFISDFDALQVAFRPFREVGDNPNNPIHLSDLKNLQSILSALVQNEAKIVRSEDGDSEIITLSFNGYRQGENFVMFFDPKSGFFPVKWVKYNTKGEICREYRVRKFDEVALQKKIGLPAEAILLEYGGHLAAPNKVPRATVEFKADYTLFENTDEVETGIDPMISAAIIDVDNTVRIEIPK